MPSVFKQSALQNVGPTPTEALSIPNGVRATVIGFNVANTTDYDVVSITVTLVDTNNVESVYIRNLPIPPCTAVKLITNGEKLIVPGNHKVNISCDTENSVDVVVSYVEMS